MQLASDMSGGVDRSIDWVLHRDEIFQRERKSTTKELVHVESLDEMPISSLESLLSSAAALRQKVNCNARFH